MGRTADLLDGLDVAAGEFIRELEGKGVGAGIDGNPAGDPLGPVRNVPAGPGIVQAEGVCEGVDVNVLQDVFFGGVGAGDAVGSEMQRELDGNGVLAEVKGVEGGDKGRRYGSRSSRTIHPNA